MRLFFSVLETYTFVVYSIMLLLWGILAPVKSPVTGGLLAFLVVVVVLSTTVTKTKATALGLSRKVQTRYNLGLAAYYVVLGAAVSVARQWWWLTAAVVVAWSIRAVVTLRQTPQSAASSDAEVHDLEERISGEGNTSFGRFPVTPAAQLVFRPLLRAWMWVVAGYAAVALSMWAAVAWGGHRRRVSQHRLCHNDDVDTGCAHEQLPHVIQGVSHVRRNAPGMGAHGRLAQRCVGNCRCCYESRCVGSAGNSYWIPVWHQCVDPCARCELGAGISTDHSVDSWNWGNGTCLSHSGAHGGTPSMVVRGLCRRSLSPVGSAASALCTHRQSVSRWNA